MKFWNKVARLVRAAGVTSLLAIGAAGLGLSSAAHAQKVLILQTTETGTGDDTGAANIHLNMLAEFENAGASVTVQNGLQTAGTVDAATFNATPPYDLVVVSSVYQAPGAGNMSAIQAAVSARSANAFVFFMDGYVDSSVTQLASLLSAVSGNAISGAVTLVGVQYFPLNAASPNQGSFFGMPTIRGGIARYLDGVPAGNMLYLPPVGDPAAQSAYAPFFPQTQVAGGNGACLLAMSDTTQFYSGDSFQCYASIRGKMAPALFAALQAPGGACGLPAASVTKSFAPATVAMGGGATLTIRLNNLSNPAMSLTGAQVQDVLPAPLVIDGTITRSCTGGTLTGAVGGSTLALSGTTIPTGGCSVTVPVRWPYAAGAASCPAGAPTTATNTITPPAQFSTDQGQSTTPATATLQCDPTLAPVVPPAVAAVPTLHGALLALLGAALAVFGWRQRPA